MVSLHRFFETDSCVFLLLQYASGGKLWTYIGDYLHTDRGNAGIELSVIKDQTQVKNIYSGTKVESDILSTDTADRVLESTLRDCVHNYLDEHDTTVHSSEGLGAVRFSDLQKRKDSAGIGNAQTFISSTSYQAEDKNCHNSVLFDAELNSDSGIKETPRKESFNEVEDHDQFNDSALASVPKHVSKAPLNRRLSNLSDDMYAAVPLDEAFSPAGLEVEEPGDGHFQKLLVETHHNIEDFSINSFDSGDVPVRINSSSSSCVDRIPSIPEDPDSTHNKIDAIPETECLSVEPNDKEEDVFSSQRDTESGEFIGGRARETSTRKTLVTRQISADQVSSPSFFSKETEDLIRDAKKRHASVDESSAQGNHHSVAVYAPTFNSDDLIRCSKDLLRHVDNVLSETGTDVPSPSPATIEVSNVSVHQQSEVSSVGGHSVTKQPSDSSQESSAEEPSIYDLNRSSDDDPDESMNIEQSTDTLHGSATGESFTASANTLEASSKQPSDPNLALEKSILKSNHPVTSIERERASSSHHHSYKVNGNRNSRLSLSHIDSKELTRSASFECDLKSPTRNRARTIADVFERLDSTSAEHIRIPESSIRKWTAQMVTAVSRLQSLGIVCR